MGPSYRALTIGIVALVLMVAFEAMAVQTAMPVAVRELRGMSWYAWGFSGFMTASMFATVVAGGLADRLGPVRPFLAGVGLFVVGMTVAGAAPVMAVFILGRAIQGLGGGALVVSLFVIAGRAYPEERLPRLMAAFSSAWVLPAIVGPAISGVVTEQLTWRLVFLGLLPLAILPLMLMLPRLRQLPEPEPVPGSGAGSGAGSGSESSPESGVGPGVESGTGSGVESGLESTPGPTHKSRTGSGRGRLALAAGSGIAIVQYAGQEPTWWSLLLALGGVALLVYALPRLLPRGSLRFARGLPTVVMMRGVMAGAFFGVQAFLPLMLKEHRGLSVTIAGLMLTFGSLGWSSGSFWQGRSNFSMPRPKVVRLGVALVTISGVFALTVLVPAVPVWLIVVGCVIGGFGMGLGMASLSVLMLTESPKAEHGTNSAAAQLADALGQVVFIGIGGVLFATLESTMTQKGLVFAPIFAVMICLGLAGVAVARRVGARE